MEQYDRILQRLKTINPREKYRITDKGFGQLFAEVFKESHRYNATAKAWFSFDGKCWAADLNDAGAMEDAKLLADALLKYAVDTGTNEKDTYKDAVYGLQGRAKRVIMLKDASTINQISAEQLDTNSRFFNCQNGVYDLKLGRLVDHDPDLFLSKVSNVIYDPDADCPDWKQFLDEVLQGDQEKIAFLQRALGYTLLGDPTEETCFILYGKTSRNGKSTFTGTIYHLFGDYARNMQPETLAHRKKDSRQASGDIARLKGCRYLNAAETDPGMLLDSQLLKQLTGKDPITARNLNEREFEFTPVFVLFMNTNYLPAVRDDAIFNSDRINVVTFNRHFEAAERRKDLKALLQRPESISGIFNWILEGLDQYKKIGLAVPESVKAENVEYEQSQDKIGQFMDEAMHKQPGTNSPISKVYTHYQVWCSSNNYVPEGKQRFIDILKRKNVYAKSGTVDGKTVRNVIAGYALENGFFYS